MQPLTFAFTPDWSGVSTGTSQRYPFKDFVLQSAHIHIQWCSPPRGNALVTIISFPERRRFHLDSASSLYSSFSFSNNTHAKSPAESFSSRFLSHIHSSILILDSPWPTYVLFPPPHTHTKFLHPRLLPSHVSHVSATLISGFYCCRCGNVDTKVLCCDTGIRTP